jgi:hypothetical protein
MLLMGVRVNQRRFESFRPVLCLEMSISLSPLWRPYRATVILADPLPRVALRFTLGYRMTPVPG